LWPPDTRPQVSLCGIFRIAILISNAAAPATLPRLYADADEGFSFGFPYNRVDPVVRRRGKLFSAVAQIRFLSSPGEEASFSHGDLGQEVRFPSRSGYLTSSFSRC